MARTYDGTHNSGLGSSASTSINGVAVVLNSNGEGGALYSTFDGVPVVSTDVLVMYTYLGDTTLKGYVDAADLANVLAGMNGHLTGWVNGDFTYAGMVTSTDLNLLLASLSGQGAPLGGGTSGSGGSGAVPEPSAAIAGMVGAPCLLRRMRRSK